MKLNPGALWPAAIVGVLALTVGANVVMLVVAREPHAAAVEPDYYNKAVVWDSTLAEARRGTLLGWSVDAALLEATRDGATVQARLCDRDGTPLTGARVRVEAIHNREADLRVKTVLAEVGEGEYSARLPLRLAGQWELRLVVTRGNEQWTTSIRREAQWSSTAR